MVTIVLQPGFAEVSTAPSPELDHSFTAVHKDTLSELYRGNKKTEHLYCRITNESVSVCCTHRKRLLQSKWVSDQPTVGVKFK